MAAPSLDPGSRGILWPGYTGTGWPWARLSPSPYALGGDPYPTDEGVGDASFYKHPQARAYTAADGSWVGAARSYNEGPGWQTDWNRNFEGVSNGPRLHVLGKGWQTPFPHYPNNWNRRPVGLPDGMEGARRWVSNPLHDFGLQMSIQTPPVFYLPDQPARNPDWAQWGDTAWSNFPDGYWWLDRDPTDEQLQAAYDNDLAGRLRIHLRQRLTVTGYDTLQTGLFNYLLDSFHHHVNLSGPSLTVTLSTPYPQQWGTSPGVVRLTVEADDVPFYTADVPIAPYEPDRLLFGERPPVLILSLYVSGDRLGVNIVDEADALNPDPTPLHEAEVSLPLVNGTEGDTFLGIEVSHYAPITPIGRGDSPWSYNWGQVIGSPPTPPPPLHQMHRDDGLNGGGQWQLAPNVANTYGQPWPGWNTGGPIWQISGYN